MTVDTHLPVLLFFPSLHVYVKSLRKQMQILKQSNRIATRRINICKKKNFIIALFTINPNTVTSSREKGETLAQFNFADILSTEFLNKH